MRLLVLCALAAIASRSDGQGLFGFDFGKAFQDPAGAFKNASENFNRVLKDPAAAFRESVNKSAEATKNFTAELDKRVRDTFKNPIGALKNLTDDVTKGVGDAVNTTLRNVNNITMTIGKNVGDIAKNPLEAFGNFTREANKNVGEIVNRTIGTVTNITQDVGKGVQRVISNPFEGLNNLTRGFGVTVAPVVATTTAKEVDNMDKKRPEPFDAAISLLDDAVESKNMLGVVATAGQAIFQAIRPVFSGKSAKQALERIDEIGKKASKGLPFIVNVLLMGPMNNLKIPLNVVAFVQSFFGMR